MLYVLTYEFVGILSQSGFVNESYEDAIKFAKSMAKIGLDQIDDHNSYDWFNLSGDEIESEELLLSDDFEEIKNHISQINDSLISNKLGYIDFLEYQDIFEVIKDQNVESWCSPTIKKEISILRKKYNDLIYNLSKEWD